MDRPAAAWTFFTNHGHVIFLLATSPDMRLRDVADGVGITERAAQRIVRDLEECGYIGIEKNGRRNHYVVYLDRPLRHPVEHHRTVRDLVDLISDS